MDALERMRSGEMTDVTDAGIQKALRKAKEAMTRFNALNLYSPDYGETLKEFLPNVADDAKVNPPLYCDYGTNITIGSGSFVNFNCVFLDGAPITIGKNVLIGPAVQIYTPIHPLDYMERRKPIERAEPVTIGDDCWICGGAVILPGVKIGNRCIIAAGSVVTQDVPDDCMAAGNPATVKKRL